MEQPEYRREEGGKKMEEEGGKKMEEKRIDLTKQV